VTLEEAQSLISPYELAILEAVRAGWQGYVERYQPNGYELSTRSRSNIVRDLIVRQLERAFDEIRLTGFLTVRGLTVLCLENRAVLRVKKLDGRLRSRNIPTRQAINYVCQAEIEGLPPGAERFNIGYRLNSMGTGIAGAFITHPGSVDEPTYAWELTAWNEVVQLPLISTVAPSPEPVASPLRVRPEVASERGVQISAEDGTHATAG
jgi:hypothetical protein